MGEYAYHQGEHVKIGTCESMLYLRADQIGDVTPDRHSLDPSDPCVWPHIRFRFPWPDEDEVLPGAFKDPFRALAVPGIEAPPEVEHGTVQFVSRRGYVVSLPCPEGEEQVEGLRVARNGFPGPVQVVQQRFWDGRLVVVCQCTGCEVAWRVEEFADARPIVAACREEATRRGSEWWREVADRIVDGYLQEAPDAS